MTEDILTGQRIHATGWKSALMDTDPPAFLGCAPTGGPATMTQFKRWATGLLEILISRRNSPILGTVFRRLQLRQCLAYMIIYVWPVRAPFELCYTLLSPFCLLTNQSFLPKVHSIALSSATSTLLIETSKRENKILFSQPSFLCNYSRRLFGLLHNINDRLVGWLNCLKTIVFSKFCTTTSAGIR